MLITSLIYLLDLKSKSALKECPPYSEKREFDQATRYSLLSLSLCLSCIFYSNNNLFHHILSSSIDGSLATQERRRYILQQTQNGGEECPTLLREERTCNKPDSCYSYTWLVGTWTECRLTGIDVVSMDGIQEQCGDGLKTRGKLLFFLQSDDCLVYSSFAYYHYVLVDNAVLLVERSNITCLSMSCIHPCIHANVFNKMLSFFSMSCPKLILNIF